MTGHDITPQSMVDLAQQLETGQLTSQTIVEAFIQRLTAIHPALNAIVVAHFDQARQEATAADAARAQRHPLGALHGLPFTIDTSLNKDTHPLIQHLRQQGAILLAETNAAPLAGFLATEHKQGLPKNPWHRVRMAGSSGGNAALIAGNGSPFAIGTDLAHGVRRASAFCGTYGFKPTNWTADSDMGQLNEAVGILGRQVADITMTWRTFTTAPTQPAVPYLWRDPQAVDVEKLQIATYVIDGHFECSPSIRRVVEEVAEFLRVQRGMVVDGWMPYQVDRVMKLFYGLSMLDLQGQGQADNRMSSVWQAATAPSMQRQALAAGAYARGQRYWARIVKSMGRSLAQLQVERKQRTEQLCASLDQCGYDAIICPATCMPALPLSSRVNLPDFESYTRLYDVTGMPAGVMPIGRVHKIEETDRKLFDDQITHIARQLEQGTTGLPVGIQIVAKHGREDIVLALMAYLEKQFRSSEDYPLNPPL